MILLISNKEKFATRRIMEESQRKGVPVTVFSVEELAKKKFALDISEFEALWIRQANPYYKELMGLAQKFKDQLKIVIDEYNVLYGFETGKWDMYQKLLAAELPIPITQPFLDHPTLALPIKGRELLQTAAAEVPLPLWEGLGEGAVVLKWNYGFGGKDTFLISSQAEFDLCIQKHPPEEWLIQEYIDATYEWEVYVKGFKSMAKVIRFGMKSLQNGPAGSFKADISNYQSFAARNFPSLLKLAEQAARETGRELCKVDILQKDDAFYILEVNRTPSFLPFEPFAAMNVAGEFINYIANRVKDGV